MSVGRGFPNMFEDDPFFSGSPSFPVIGFPRHRALSDGAGGSRDRQIAQRRDPFGLMWPFVGGDPFSQMHSMMNGMMQGAESNSNAHCFSSSSVMHYSSGGDGRQPKVYQATTSTRKGPGGVKETRKTMRDSESGLQKMAIGHHINDRSHTIERRVNTKTDEREEHQEFVDMEESDAPQFDREWKDKSRQLNTRLHPSLRSPHHPRALPSLEASSSRHHTHKHHPYSTSHHTRPTRHAHAHLEPLEPDIRARPSHVTDHMTGRPSNPQPGEERRHKTNARVKKEANQ